MPEWLATPKMWGDIFVVGVPIVEKILRPALVYVFLVVALRVFGKRELAQLNPFDLVVLLSLSNTVQNAIIGNDNSLTGGLIGALALMAINYLVVRFLFRHRRLDEILEGEPTLLIEHGSVKTDGPGEGIADHSRTHDRAAPPGVRKRGRGGALYSGARGHVRRQGNRPARRKAGPRRNHERPERSQRQARCPGAGARPRLTFYNKEAGGMGEWLKPAVLKTVNGETRSGVRIPLPPPNVPNGSGPQELPTPKFRSSAH